MKCIGKFVQHCNGLIKNVIFLDKKIKSVYALHVYKTISRYFVYLEKQTLKAFILINKMKIEKNKCINNRKTKTNIKMKNMEDINFLNTFSVS